MTYKYDETLLFKEKVIELINDKNEKYDLVKSQLKVYPLYFIPSGEIFYGGITHNQADIKKHLKELIICKLLGGCSSLSKVKTTKELLSDLKLVTYQNVENFSYLNLWDAINHPAILSTGDKLPIYEGEDIYTYEAMQLCNTVNKAKYLIDKKILEIANQFDSNEKFLDSFFKFYNYNIEECRCLDRNNRGLEFTSKTDKIEEIINQITNDIFVLMIGFDKIESVLKKTITTTNKNHHEVFFNYYLMDFNIVYLPKIVFDNETKSFKLGFFSDIYTKRDNEYSEEIELIKQKVLLKDRSKYFL